MEGLEAILLKALIDLLKCLSKLKVVYRRIELESHKIINIEGIHVLEWLLFMNKGRKDQLQIDLHRLIEIINVDICELVLPYFNIVDLLRRVVEISPESERSLGIAKYHV